MSGLGGNWAPLIKARAGPVGNECNLSVKMRFASIYV